MAGFRRYPLQLPGNRGRCDPPIRRCSKLVSVVEGTPGLCDPRRNNCSTLNLERNPSTDGLRHHTCNMSFVGRHQSHRRNYLHHHHTDCPRRLRCSRGMLERYGPLYRSGNTRWNWNCGNIRHHRRHRRRRCRCSPLRCGLLGRICSTIWVWHPSCSRGIHAPPHHSYSKWVFLLWGRKKPDDRLSDVHREQAGV